MSKVSVILPSLNVAGYIRETMESVLAQTLPDMEIICVDAGSTDGTLEIIEEMASNDDRIIIIKSDKKSYGYQMNIGIAAASGEYIGIVETDDYIEADMYQCLYEEAKKYDADIVKSDFDLFTTLPNGERLFADYSLKRFNSVDYNVVYSGDDYVKGRIKPECYIWNAIYRKNFLEKNDVRFNETPGASFQDFGFRYQTCFFAEAVIAIQRVFYHYRRDNSAASTYNPKTVEYNLRESRFVLEIIERKGIYDRSVYKALAKEIVEFAFWPYLELLKWTEPDEGTTEAFDGYRVLLDSFVKNEYISEDELLPSLWLDTNLLLEGTEVFIGYATVMARLNRNRIRKFIDEISNAAGVYIFGTGVRGKAAYIFLKNNGVNNIKAFCDNNRKKQGSKLYGAAIISPEDAAYDGADSLFLISSPSVESEMRKQLNELGISDRFVLTYNFATDPLFCTNCLTKTCSGN